MIPEKTGPNGVYLRNPDGQAVIDCLLKYERLRKQMVKLIEKTYPIGSSVYLSKATYGELAIAKVMHYPRLIPRLARRST